MRAVLIEVIGAALLVAGAFLFAPAWAFVAAGLFGIYVARSM